MTTMHRLLSDTQDLERPEPVLSDAARRHMRVLRLKSGEAVELFDGVGRVRACVFENGTLRAAGPVLVRPRPPELVLFACVTKGARWDWTVEKATELGVTRLVPVLSERTVVRLRADEREAKRLRWRRIAEEAARQSDAAWLPEVLAPVPFDGALALARETTCFVGALTHPPAPPLAVALDAALADADAAARPFAVFVGPEGDFTPGELAALAAAGRPAGFGPSVLRAETAALYAVSVVKAALDAGRCRVSAR